MERAPFYLRIFVVSIADKGYVIQDSEATTVESASKFKFRLLNGQGQVFSCLFLRILLF